jgi:hypothetical protein
MNNPLNWIPLGLGILLLVFMAGVSVGQWVQKNDSRPPIYTPARDYGDAVLRTPEKGN